ncbi:S9 family peptidase [Deinococcus cellulosilyticus]|uniref:Peptidase S9 n=1 Tax=Deinococcus cellulosilyticus (strain DSM 18568 / NBRC 106333 / KACC 11606 / 5516J-15) TaxID=1223518 RepID=A0A511N717_DEIC1|nr:S9 family peptidase [Deinococcus cellulosilyticus]GEM48211.1 peptidase S9 [Deinococcus cellulosilyticus NBRC 106333 = KACC 11606]
MLKPDTLLDLHFVSDPQVWGSKVAFVRATPQQKKYITQIYLWEEGELSQLTQGEHQNTSPRFSPDGQSLAFISNRSGTNQIYLLRLRGGEARQITHLETDPWNVQWSPDGQCLSFMTAPEKTDHEVVYTTTLREYHANGEGLFSARPDQIHLLRISDGQVSALTHSEVYIMEHQWLPDSSGVAYISSPSADEAAQARFCVYRQKLNGVPEQVMDATADLGQLSVQPDGSGFVVSRKEQSWCDAHLYYYHWDGTHKRLDEGFDYPLGNYVLGDMQHGAYPTRAQWLDAQTLLAVYTLGGSSGLFTVKLSGDVTPLLHHHARVISAVHVCQGKVAFIEECSTELPEVYLWEDGVVTPVSQQGALIVDWPIVEPISLRVGNVEGWVLLPTQTEGRIPVVLSIHGGPHMAYGHAFMHEFQVFVQQGYAVLYCNPRGSVGYGQGHSGAIRGCWGSVDQDDLLAFLDAALAQYSALDPARMAVVGGSYGGYMVNWITSHTSRFKRAITDRCVSNLVSFAGTSDIGAFFGQHELGSNPFTEDAGNLWNLSPLKYVSQVKTPTLVVHSEQDLRCPLEQGQQWYAALKTLGIETRFVRFPEENHELSRSGRPDRRIVRLKEYLAWLSAL